MSVDVASVLDAHWDAMRKADFDAAAALYADDAVVDIVGLALKGRVGVREHLERFHEAFPDSVYEVNMRDPLPGGRVLEQWTLNATHQGSFVGRAPTGKPVKLSAVSIYRFCGAHVVDEQTYAEMSQLMLATGVFQVQD